MKEEKRINRASLKNQLLILILINKKARLLIKKYLIIQEKHQRKILKKIFRVPQNFKCKDKWVPIQNIPKNSLVYIPSPLKNNNKIYKDRIRKLIHSNNSQFKVSPQI